MSWCLNFCAVGALCVFHIFSQVKVTECPPIGKIAAHSTYEMFSWYQYLIVGLVFSHLGFWSGNVFLIALFPDLCLLVPSYMIEVNDYIEKSGYFFFQKAEKNRSHDFNPEETEK